MEYRRLGAAGLKVSTLTMGTMTIGGRGWSAMVGNVGLSEARRQIDMCIDAGVNLIDTADIYSQGASEEIIGEALGGQRKGGLLIATKGRFAMGAGPNNNGSSRQHLIEACEASLKRLRTDVIDLYQLHAWDGQTPLEETLEALDTLLRQGKIRYIGCSNFSGWHIMKALGVARADGRQPFASQQIHYSLESRDCENELIPLSIDQELGVLVWSPLAGGLLSGKHKPGAAADGSRQLAGWNEPPIYDEERLWRIVDALVAVAEGCGGTPSQVALAWLLGRPAVSSVIVGARTDQQWRDNLAAADLKLSVEDRAALDAVSQKPLMYPYWHQANTAADRMSPADEALLGPFVAPTPKSE